MEFKWRSKIQRLRDRVDKLHKWHKVFLWWPTRICDYIVVFESVERSYQSANIGYNGLSYTPRLIKGHPSYRRIVK